MTNIREAIAGQNHFIREDYTMERSKPCSISMVASGLILMLSACGGAPEEVALAPSECVPIGDAGTFYVVDENGLLVPTEQPEAEIRVLQAPKGWAQDLESTFADMGFPWMQLNVRGEVATLVGLAPTQDAADRGYEAGKTAILSNERGSRQITIVPNGIAVEGGEAGVAAALSELSDRPSLTACQQAFKDTMRGRNVEFRTGSATIRSESAQLLDAVTGVGLFCKDYEIEIGGHTDVTGSQAVNQQLSDARANKVRDYLIARGVPEDRLTAVGYGSSQPIDPSDSLEAYAKNRRTEFIVRDR